MSRRPVIGLTSSQMPVDYGALPRYPLNYVAEDYTKAVLSAGGNPMLLGLFDPEEHPDLVGQQLDLVDGLLLTGGMDISPALYGEPPHPRIGRQLPVRDRNEIALYLEARRRGLPVLAICRGIQLVNVALGGTLYQDIPAQLPDAHQHEQRTERSQVAHGVTVKPGSLLADILGDGALEVTSFHHQAVKDLADGLVVVATASDGVIEAVESSADEWLLAVQWHPEMSRPVDPRAQRVFDAFLARCGK